MTSFATKIMFVCLFTAFSSIATAGDFGSRMSEEEYYFLVSIGVIVEDFAPMDEVPAKNQTSKSYTTNTTQADVKGVSGLDLGSGRIKGLAGLDLGSGRITGVSGLDLGSSRFK
ncbi:hypothetical protein [Thalassoglobus polymorphus]|uniref:Uncharacterized protein n=1 Tax=Thalassoglobus polymorphus TaxID=2527994 RepID=A0A517QIG2_9PLAN|nr:hypothetical protein [Thalassoglobus polymorphus]QDT31419.1 hypothetical protein Mal48_06520 [Thalassoglobus polymorphus]